MFPRLIGETTPDSFPFVRERSRKRVWGRERERGRTVLPTIVGGSFVQVAKRRVDPTALPFMSNSRVEMLNCSGPSLYVYKNVLNKMLILIDEVGAKGTIILIKSRPYWCDGVECYWSLKFMLLGGSEKGTQRVVSRSVIIPHLQVFLLPQSLSSLVKRKSICTDVYEEWKIAQRKRKEKKKGILMKEGQWKLRIDDLLLVCVRGLFVCSPDWLQLAWRCIRESSTMKSVSLNSTHY